MENIYDINVVKKDYLITPEALRKKIPVTDNAKKTVLRRRQELKRIMDGKDDRMVIITGPCSIHDPVNALEYAKRLVKLKKSVEENILLVMRTYFEKPRTIIGWKGMIDDPFMDNSFEIDEGYLQARRILTSINDLGVPCACEILRQETAERINGLLAWACVGARTTESQIHREMASGFSPIVGFKNATGNGPKTAVEAAYAATQEQVFLGNDKKGLSTRVKTAGNPYTHLVLRGNEHGPNYYPYHIQNAYKLLEKLNMRKIVMVDCSHANSGKDYRQQPRVFCEVLRQRIGGPSRFVSANPGIVGLMLESNLHAGKQNINSDCLKDGVSVTDACINWETTEELIMYANKELEKTKEKT